MNEEVPQTVMALMDYHRGTWRAMHCFRSFHTAERTIEGIEAMHVLRKGQAKFIESLFGVAT